MRLKFMVFCTITGYFNYLARLLWSDTRVRIIDCSGKSGQRYDFTFIPSTKRSQPSEPYM